MNTVTSYFSSLGQAIARGWNRFWFRATDPFSLCVIRVLVGAAAFYYVFSFTSDLNTWFAPDGLLPVETVRSFTGAAQGQQLVVRPSYLNYVDSSNLLYAVHGAGLVITLLLLIGLFTRITSILTLCVVLSYVHRAPLITGLFEPILAMLLLYLCLAPAGAYLSLDHWLRGRRAKAFVDGGQPRPSIAANISQRLMQVHLSGFYLMFALNKLEGPTWWEGDAVWWLIARPESRLVDLTFLARHTYLINFWTHAVIALELALGILIWSRWARPLLLLLAVPLWISLALITGELAFCLLMLVANLSFVSPQFMRELLSRQRTAAATV